MRTKNNPVQGWLYEDLSYCAENGDIDGMKEQLAKGADLFYHACNGFNVLDQAVRRNKLVSVKFLLEQGYTEKPQYTGKALIYAKDPEIFRSLANSRPDLTVDVFKGLTPFDYLFLNGNHDQVDLYRRYGLPQPPLNPKVLRPLGSRCDLDGWEDYTGISVPDQYKREWETIPLSCLYSTQRKRRKFKKLLAEVTKAVANKAR